MYIYCRFSVKLLILIFTFPALHSQVSRKDIKPLLSVSDQKAYEKTGVIYSKARSAENEANILSGTGTTEKEKARNEKKYLLKRLEAAQNYEKANRDLSGLLKDNLSRFRKNNKQTDIPASILNHEEEANELLRQAKTLRKASEKLVYPHEKLEKIIEAEDAESRAIDILAKVLYACHNQPVDYDVLLSTRNNPDETSAPASASKKVSKKSQEITYIPVDTQKPANNTPTIKDTVPGKNQPENKRPVQNESNTPENASIYDLVKVKENEVDDFNKFLEASYPQKYEHYIINFRELNYRETDSLKAAWYRYTQVKFTPEEIASLKKTGAKDSAVLIAEKTAANTQEKAKSQDPANRYKTYTNHKDSKEPDPVAAHSGTSTTKTGSEVASQTRTKSSKPAGKKETGAEKKEIRQANTFPAANEIAKGFVYRVQISACRIPLDSNSLDHIYRGNFKIKELKEENWYKYAIGEFSTYNEARHLKEQVNIPGAFIIAYLNGKRIPILNTHTANPESQDNGENIRYKVQIAASKKSLNSNYLKNIYPGSKNIEEILEDGWYKYSVNTGSLTEAINFIQNEDIPGAFIVSYRGDKKIELREALRLDRNR